MVPDAEHYVFGKLAELHWSHFDGGCIWFYVKPAARGWKIFKKSEWKIWNLDIRELSCKLI